jgi:IS30 family transposase
MAHLHRGRPLDQFSRFQIARLRKMRYSLRAIAKAVGCSVNTVRKYSSEPLLPKAA